MYDKEKDVREASTPRFFKPMDLVAPIGVCLVAAALCTLGVIKATEVAGKIISGLVGTAFLAALIPWYFIRLPLRYDLVTKHGLVVELGEKNKPTRAVIELWTEELMDFWNRNLDRLKALLPPQREGVEYLADLARIRTIFVDEEGIELPVKAVADGVFYQMVRGYSYIGQTSGIGMLMEGSEAEKLSYTKGGFLHELSHQVIRNPAKGNLSDHDIFRELGLPA